MISMTGRSRGLMVLALVVTFVTVAVVLFLATRPRDPLKAFTPYIETVRANIDASIREGFVIQDREDPYLNSGIVRIRETKVDAFHVGDVLRTDSLIHPVSADIRIIFSRSVDVDGLRRTHVTTFANESGIETITAIADVRCGWDGKRWKLLELRQTPVVSLVWETGSRRGRMSEGDLAESTEARQWFKILRARVDGESG
jgi:hypothetical protein